MKSLVDNDNRPCDTNDDKLQALVDHNFFTKDQAPLEGGANVENERGGGYSMEELEEKLREALRGTSNRSAPGPDSISYWFIKMVLDTRLEGEVVWEVAESLKEGRIPGAWQNSNVVFIPKPNKDHKAAKGWRPINLINCIGKLAEKVVADELQVAGLFYKGQYGGIRGRSAMEAMMRALTRVQRALVRGGQVLWVMEDIKGGFNNVLGQEVLDAVARSEKRGWGRWLRDLFRPRQFEVEWDSKVQGQGSANVGVLQGSPLSPVVFLIWMEPILRRMEERVKAGIGLDVEMPSFVDDMCVDIVDWEGVRNMQQVEVDIKRIVRKVAEENNLHLEAEKEEVLHFQKTRKKRNTDRKQVKWLGVNVTV